MRTLLLVTAMIISGYAWADDEDIVEPSPFCQSVVNAIGSTPDETIRNLGNPISREVSPVENPYTRDAKDNMTVINYPEGRVSFRYLNHDDRYLLLDATLPFVLFSTELHRIVPATIKEVTNRWGEANETADDHSRYYCTFESVEWVDILTKSGQVTGIAYTGYAD